jgi:SpoVK/Ycf46/Vps4 family AAA+-type ATPase
MPLGNKIDPRAPQPPPPQPPPAKTADIAAGGKKAEAMSFSAVEPKFTIDDLIITPATRNAILDALTIYAKRDLIFNEWGLGATHKQQNKAGINLYGAPGTGKTMAAHAIASHLGRKLLIVDYSQIESKYVGETSKNLVAMFEYAKAEGSVIFFDEADALLSKRVTDMSSSTDVSVNQTRSVLLILISDYNDIILFATNFVSNFDPAFMRRISSHVKFELPDEDNRVKLWEMYIPKEMPTDADIPKLAKDYSGVSGSDISNAVLSAALRAARNGDEKVKHEYFAEAVLMALKSKEANSGFKSKENNGDAVVVSERFVSEEYVKQQLNGKAVLK